MRRNMSGRKLVITGAARGIGEKVARLATARGARVGLVGLEPDRLSALAADLGPAALWRKADVRDGAALRSSIDDCAQAMGGIDIVVANAGVAAYGTVRQADEASFERVLDINVNGVFRTLKYATPHLERSRGHAMVVASAISFTPLAGLASYAASKAGVEMLALAYRQEVAHLGITVGSCTPRGSTPTSSEVPRRTSPHSRNCARGYRIQAMSPRASTARPQRSSVDSRSGAAACTCRALLWWPIGRRLR
jgi:NAD(P)-dependent dehydrogenase (short-subunit alcohol dehydrogenase family)